MNRFQEAIEEGSLPFTVQASENILALDGGRTLGWEIAEEISRNPIDYLFIQVGGGALLTSCVIGLLEAKQLGVISKVPKVCAVQAEGCAPLDRAWRGIPRTGTAKEKIDYATANAETLMTPWEGPESLATGILDDITYDWIGVVQALAQTGGESIVASEKEIAVAHALANSHGASCEPTGSAGVAGVIAALRTGYIRREDRVGVLLTGVQR
jgi:threonine synthase